MIADHAIVADVRVGHDQIVAADARGAAALDRAAMHGAELAKLVRVAHFEPHALARVGQILRIAADDGKRVHMIVAAERGRALDHGVRFENAAVAEFHFVAHDGECARFELRLPNFAEGETTARGSISLIALSRQVPWRAAFPFPGPPSCTSTWLRRPVRRSRWRGRGACRTQILAPGDHIHFQPQLVAGNHRPAEARIVNGDEIEKLFFAVRQLPAAAGIRPSAPWIR